LVLVAELWLTAATPFLVLLPLQEEAKEADCLLLLLVPMVVLAAVADLQSRQLQVREFLVKDLMVPTVIQIPHIKVVEVEVLVRLETLMVLGMEATDFLIQ
jgi:hypothetical protein